MLWLDRNLLPVIFVSYDPSFGLLTYKMARVLSPWQTSQSISLREAVKNISMGGLIYRQNLYTPIKKTTYLLTPPNATNIMFFSKSKLSNPP